MLERAREALAAALESPGTPTTRGRAMQPFIRALSSAPQEVVFAEVAAQIRLIFERDFLTGFEALMATSPLDLTRLYPMATPERLLPCVRARARWVTAQHRGERVPEPGCSAR